MPTNLLQVSLEVLGKVLDKFPTYDQAKKEKYHKMKMEYINEKLKEPYHRDDNKIVNLEIQLREYLNDFSSFLGSQK